MTIHKPVLGTGYSGTVFVSGALHAQLHMDDVIGLIVGPCDDVIGLIVDDVIIFLY